MDILIREPTINIGLVEAVAQIHAAHAREYVWNPHLEQDFLILLRVRPENLTISEINKTQHELT